MAVVKVWKQGSSLIVTLPAQVCELWKIEEGTELAMDVFSDTEGYKIVLEGMRRMEK